jgi:DNA-directed RNA polymerase omega subunit
MSDRRNNAHCTIPDDPEQSTYRFIIVAAKRARQLQGGARPFLATSSKKWTIIAAEEVRPRSGEVEQFQKVTDSLSGTTGWRKEYTSPTMKSRSNRSAASKKAAAT